MIEYDNANHPVLNGGSWFNNRPFAWTLSNRKTGEAVASGQSDENADFRLPANLPYGEYNLDVSIGRNVLHDMLDLVIPEPFSIISRFGSAP